MGLLESLAGSQRGARQCELVMNPDCRNIGNPRLPETILVELIWGNYRRKIGNRKSVIAGNNV